MRAWLFCTTVVYPREHEFNLFDQSFPFFCSGTIHEDNGVYSVQPIRRNTEACRIDVIRGLQGYLGTYLPSGEGLSIMSAGTRLSHVAQPLRRATIHPAVNGTREVHLSSVSFPATPIISYLP